ncbi:MAG: cytochrome c oxidase subunit 3 family protein [Nitrospirae bacterium]|nr:cytochrome c oxidase subunit 3 family protein [Nitrospirota bacterium]MBI5696854.1 cytochrome c oxidase subunit 3 family protein [Nitrospirota bacterium]
MPDEGGKVETAHADAGLAYESSKLGIWIFLGTEVLLFGGLFLAYAVFRIKYPELFHRDHLELNRTLGTVNTVVLICSSLSVAAGITAIRNGKADVLKKSLVVTLLLGATFLAIKYFEWSEDFAHGIYPGTDVFFSLYFMMAGVHGFHVLCGLLVMAWLLVQAGRGRFSAEYSTPVELTGIYWHFVDLVWIYLYPMFYLIG